MHKHFPATTIPDQNDEQIITAYTAAKIRRAQAEVVIGIQGDK